MGARPSLVFNIGSELLQEAFSKLLGSVSVVFPVLVQSRRWKKEGHQVGTGGE